MNKYLVICLILLLSISIKAQTPEWIFYNELNSGLPDNQVHTIAIDNNIKWIGTVNGLARFDGTSWQVFNTSNSGLPSNVIYSLEVVGDEIWIGTSNGLAKFNGTDWTVFNNTDTVFVSPAIIEIVKDRQNNYWVASELNIVKFIGSSWEVSNKLDAIGAIQSLAVDSIGQIWVGDFDLDTHNGVLWKFDGTNINYYPMRHYPELISSFPYAISFDVNNILWMVISGTVGGGLVKIENENWTIFKSSNSGFPNSGGSSLTIKDNIKWIGTSDGLISFDGETWNLFDELNSQLPDDWVYSIALDQFGNKWLGTISGGIAVFNEGGISDNNDETENYLDKYSLCQNYPNPFNPSTKIRYIVVDDADYASPMEVKLTVFDILGNEIVTLVNEEQKAGTYEVEFTDNSRLASGVYFYQLQINNFVETKKMILLR